MAYTWDGSRYRDEHGQPVPDKAVLDALATIQRTAAGQITVLSQRVTAGQMRPTIWERNMAGVLRNASLSAAALAGGGLANLPAHEGRVVDRLTVHFEALNGFRQQLGSLSEGAVAARAQLYTGLIGQVYGDVSRAVLAETGDGEEMNVLGASAQSCEECLALTDQGWVGLGSLPEPGSRQCGPGCNCAIQTRRVGAEAGAA